MTAALETRGLSVRYGGVRAVQDVDLLVEPGTLVGLIGPNGAGKTSVIDALAGFAASTGQVLLDGRDVSRLGPHRRARSGFARTWQSVDLFEDLTVRENLTVGTVGRDVDQHVEDVALRLGISELLELPCDLLTQTRQRKLVGIARALVSEPRVLCLDEPAAGLDIIESAALGERLRSLADDGLALLLVDHDMGLVLSICDLVVVLEFGSVIACGTPDEVRTDARVVSAYLGDRTPAGS